MFTRQHRAGRRALALAALTLLGACQDPVSAPNRPAASTTRATADAADDAPARATLAWNKVARDLVAKYGTSAPGSIRTFTLLSVAQYNAIVEAERGRSAGADTKLSVAARPSDRGAVAGASAAVLASAYPQSIGLLQRLVAEQRAAEAPDGGHDDFAAGEAVGRAIAAGLIAHAESDRYFAPFTGTVPICPGCWVAVPTPPAFATLGDARPYFLTSNSQFRPPPPPEFGSPAFLADLAEVRQIADTRTPAQDSIAKFWALPVGTVGAQGYLNVVAADLVARYRQSEREAAHTMALLNIAAYDAIISSHAAKYHYWYIRPSQADPGIVRAIGLPSFPSYPSNHAALVAVAATVLGRVFPDEQARLDAMEYEGGISRVYGGIHYRFDMDAGFVMGRQVARWTLDHDVAAGQPFGLP